MPEVIDIFKPQSTTVMIRTLLLLDRKVDTVLGADINGGGIDPVDQMKEWLLNSFICSDYLEEFDTISVQTYRFGNVHVKFENGECFVEHEDNLEKFHNLDALKAFALQKDFQDKDEKRKAQAKMMMWFLPNIRHTSGPGPVIIVETSSKNKVEVKFEFGKCIIKDGSFIQEFKDLKSLKKYVLNTDFQFRDEMKGWLLKNFSCEDFANDVIFVDRLYKNDGTLHKGNVKINFEYRCCMIAHEQDVEEFHDLGSLKEFALINSFQPNKKWLNINHLKYWLFETFEVEIGTCTDDKTALYGYTGAEWVTFTFEENITHEHVYIIPYGKIFTPSENSDFQEFVNSLGIPRIEQ